jgi:xanthine dehydrogenase YagR molybdenum-binding subunit
MTVAPARAVGAPIERLEAREKVTGRARYAYEIPVEGVAYAAVVPSTIAKGRIAGVDASEALALRGVLAVLWEDNAPPVSPDHGDWELAVLQTRDVAYRGQIVAAVVAESFELATQAARLVRVSYERAEHDVVLREDHPRLYAPEKVNPAYATDTEQGDPDAALHGAAVLHDATYRTPTFHNNAMEPHAALAFWTDGDLTIHDSSQGVAAARQTIARVLGLPPERVRVISEHVGGGFGSKGQPRPTAVLAALAASAVGRPVKVAATRREMFAFTGYRTPTIQRVRLGAGADGRLQAIVHDVAEQTSTVKEFAEQTAVVTRMMYAAPSRRTTHRVAALDVPTPSWMRAPGECPGMYALESAMDELAIACGLDPIELRVRNEPDVDPESGLPFSSRSLVACMREGARLFGWEGRDHRPGPHRAGRAYVGTGVAASTYPARRRAASATARATPDGRYEVRIAAADIGTGARTALTQIAADALDAELADVTVHIGDSDLPFAPVAGGSAGTASWGTAIVRACEALRERLAEAGGTPPPEGLEAFVDTSEEIEAQAQLSRHAYGAQFCEVHVDADTGEITVPRMLGVFGVGRVMNAKTARSQFIGGMTMGLSMALFEESVLDEAFGDYLNSDLAGYHIAACADVRDIEAVWVDEPDDQLNPMGSKGIGEIGIVGTAAAVANVVHHATGLRIRELPITPDKILGMP